MPLECPLRSIKLKAKVLIALKVIFRLREFYLGREELYTDILGAESTQMGVGGTPLIDHPDLTV